MTIGTQQHGAPLLARLLRPHMLRRGAAVACVLALAGSAVAQPTNSAVSDPEPLPSLDELLGLTEPGEIAPNTSAPDLGDSLHRALTGEGEQRDPFKAAVDLMDRSRSRLESLADAGVATQRLQADALARLDQVIAQAKARQQQSQNSSSSSSQSSQQQQQQPSQQQAQSSQQKPGEGDNQGEVMAPGLSGVNSGPNVDSAGAAWGALPARLRGALLQGVADQYSSLYERLTEKYYQRLAEEADQ
ncbi:MAG: hypothetical protein ACI89L_000712 [Phycisphaerales bacterium]|jgi:hypothetical protein